MSTLDISDKQLARFISRMGGRGLTECWEWRAGRQTAGYGAQFVGRKIVTAHRISYFLAHGQIPDGFDILHRCDNPPCCNPAHLFAGTAADNIRDMTNKGRRNDAFGEDAGRAVLTEDQVNEIRGRYIPGRVTQKNLAAEYGVSRGAVRDIVGGRSWKHLL